MRLLAVRLQNLNSLSGAHEVQFDEPLTMVTTKAQSPALTGSASHPW